ncbi:MAG: DUF1499 domain-containing protein [Rhodanobacter sp.]
MSARIKTVARRRQGSRWTLAMVMLGLLLGLVALVSVALPGLLYHRGQTDLHSAFGSIRLGAFVGIAAIVASLVGIVLAVHARQHRRALYAVLGLLLGVAAFVPPWLLARQAASLPAIHDISTDTINPPPFVAILPLRAKAPNSAVYGGAEVAAKQHAAYPDIQPLQSSQTPAALWEVAHKVALAMDWQIVDALPDAGRLEATATTTWFGFKDDVVIRIRPEGNGSRLDIRSESRVGGSDIGANATRIREFMARMHEALGTPAS